MTHFRVLTAVLWISILIVPCARAQDDIPKEQNAVTGYWQTEDKDGVIELYPCRDRICGRFHWLKDDTPERPSLDEHNPDPALRTRPLCRMQFMGGFEPHPGGYFSGGWIYSVRDGNTYSASLKLLDDKRLELRGYLLLPVFGQSRVWTRTGPEPACQR